MRLESARALKEAILIGDGEAAVRAFGARRAGGTPPAGLAVGVALTRPGNYGIAVRLQDMTPDAKEFVAYVTDAAFDEVDIRITGPIRPLVRQRPLQRGASIGHAVGNSGTLGCFVRCRLTSAIGVLSNNHVIANENAAALGDAIVQPSKIDGGIAPHDVVGTLERYVQIHPAGRNRVDAAFAALAQGVEMEPDEVSGVDEPEEHETVEKVGSATGHTQGWIDAFDLDGVVVEYTSLGRVTFDGVVEVRSSGPAFSAPGDSGSVIVGDNGHAVALLFAGTDGADPLTYGNRFADVLRELDAELMTTG